MPRISHKIQNDSVNTLTSIARTTARKSECLQKLGAIITKGELKLYLEVIMMYIEQFI